MMKPDTHHKDGEDEPNILRAFQWFCAVVTVEILILIKLLNA